jgi:hypothetical protein
MQIRGSHADSKALTSASALCGTAEAVPFVHHRNPRTHVIQTAPMNRGNLFLFGHVLFKAINKLHRQKAS